jgi:hypothetical protein
MATVVPTQVSSAELKLRQKLSEQREREDAKLVELRIKEAQKVVNKIAATKMGLDTLVSRAEFGTLPDMVRTQLLQLFTKLEGIHGTCTSIIDGCDDGDIITMQDTIHT